MKRRYVPILGLSLIFMIVNAPCATAQVVFNSKMTGYIDGPNEKRIDSYTLKLSSKDGINYTLDTKYCRFEFKEPLEVRAELSAIKANVIKYMPELIEAHKKWFKDSYNTYNGPMAVIGSTNLLERDNTYLPCDDKQLYYVEILGAERFSVRNRIVAIISIFSPPKDAKADVNATLIISILEKDSGYLDQLTLDNVLRFGGLALGIYNAIKPSQPSQ